jgi:hypothetical protein
MRLPTEPLVSARITPSGWPALPASFLAGTAVLAVVAGLAGWLARSVTAPAPVAPVTAPRAVALGPVGVKVPASWAPARAEVAGVPDLGSEAVVFAPVPGLGARAVLTLAPFDDETLVPAPLRPLIGGAPRPVRATLAGMQAWSYSPQAVGSGQLAQVTVAPTSAGSLAVVCVAPDDAWSGAADCVQGVTAAGLRGATPLVPSPTLAFRRELVPAVDRLGARRAELRGRLGAAPTRAGQARFAVRLDRAHARAATVLAPRATASGAPRAVVLALTRTARSYRRLAAAALSGWPVRYKRARAAVARQDRALARAISQVR